MQACFAGTYRDRNTHKFSGNKYQCCHYADKCKISCLVVFHSSILDNDYALGQIIRQGGTPIIYGEHYMAPIIQAFKQKKEKSAQAE